MYTHILATHTERFAITFFGYIEPFKSKHYSEFTKNFYPGGLPYERGRDALRLT